MTVTNDTRYLLLEKKKTSICFSVLSVHYERNEKVRQLNKKKKR
jgi:hypothetical protein